MEDFFDDRFDIIDDDKDALAYKADELNKYFFSGHLNSMALYDNEEEEAEEAMDDVIIVEVKLVR